MENHGTVTAILEYKQNINSRGDNNLNNYTKDLIKYDFKMEELRLFDSFAGIGALHQALKELGIPVKLIGMSEVDVNAIISYAGVHQLKIDEVESLEDKEMRKYLMDRNIGWSFEENKSKIPRMKKDMVEKCYKVCVLANNYGDISKLDYDNLPDFNLFNFSFPCQSVSIAGKQEGFTKEDGTITRSGLYKYGIEVIKAKKPKYIMIENVKGLITKKFINGFYSIVNEIESLGYNCYYPKKDNGQPTCLNTKDYGIPQNRERIFVICIRKDVDNGDFGFPKGFDNGIRLKDLLEDSVDEKYYLSQDIQDRFKLNGNQDIDHNELNVVGSSAPDFITIGQRDMTYDINRVMSTLTATDYKKPKQIICEQRCDEGLRFFKDNICGTIRTINSGGDKRVIELSDNKLNQIGELELEGYNDFSKRVYDIEGIGRTLMASGGNLNDKAGQYLDKSFKIRRLTPKECWRLMGFRDEHIERAMALGASDSQLYKQAGNSIVVDVLYYIFKELFKDYIQTK